VPADNNLHKLLTSWLAVPGVLVLSEFAGAAQSLGAGAILVNPWNITDMAAAIEDALTMSEQVLPAVMNPSPRYQTLQHHCRISRNGVGSL
jgi:Glycosyltransferase family 20